MKCTSCKNGEIDEIATVRAVYTAEAKADGVLETHGRFLCDGHKDLIASDYGQDVSFTALKN
jgi:hypothetical protein